MATRLRKLIALDTSVYFATGDTLKATQSGLKNMGLGTTEPYSMVTTDTFQLITHEVMPKSQALSCNQCHGSTASQMKLKDLGYVMKGTASQTCTQCHGQKNIPAFTSLHDKHVKDKKIDCSKCHAFSRPERALTARR
jgi:DnaJ-class molecular chaperone